MNKKRRAACICLGFARNRQQGMTLIEVLIALGILAAVATVYLASMTTSSKAVIIGQEQVTGENLAKSQIEAIKRWEYDDDNNPPNYDAAELADKPVNYDIGIQAVRLDPRCDGFDNDDGLQQITVTVTHKGDTIYTLEDYKCFTGH